MLEIMLFKLHVTSLAIKEHKKNSHSLLSSFLPTAVKGELRGLFLGNSNLGYVRQKAKNLHRA